MRAPRWLARGVALLSLGGLVVLLCYLRFDDAPTTSIDCGEHEEPDALCVGQLTSDELRFNTCPTLPPRFPFGERFVGASSAAACQELYSQLRDACDDRTEVRVEAARGCTAGWRHGARGQVPYVLGVYPHAQRACNAEMVESLRMPKEWETYRFVDMTLNACHLLREPFCTPATCADELRNGSLAMEIAGLCQMLERPRAEDNNWPAHYAKAVLQVIRSRLNAAGGRDGGRDKDVVVVHLRLGDVLEEKGVSTQEMLNKDIRYRQHARLVRPLSYFAKAIEKISLAGKRVVIIGAAHIDDTLSPMEVPLKSCLYVHSVADFFLKAGAKSVDLRLGGLPDDDIMEVARSAYFIPSGGGFSVFLAKLVQKLGGTVLYGPHFWMKHGDAINFDLV